MLGSLIEKEITTPEYYPLSLNALASACNQISNRDPAVSFDEKTVRLEVHDNGGGFDVSMAHDGLGLLGIRERVSQMCGELVIESRPGAGTRIGVVLPYA